MYRQNHLEKYKLSQKKQYSKRKLAGENENYLHLNQHEKHSDEHTCKVLSFSKPQMSMNMSECIEMFHKDISVGPEYVCSCCQQLWYKSSVSKCNLTLYKTCSKEIIDLCITGLTSFNDTEWIYVLHATRT